MVYAYIWDENGYYTNGAWPVRAIKYDSYIGYYLIVNIMPGSNIIFSDGTYQTGDLSVTFNENNLFTSTTISTNGRIYTGYWSIYYSV